MYMIKNKSHQQCKLNDETIYILKTREGDKLQFG